MSSEVDVIQYLKAIFGGAEGFIEFRLLGKGKSTQHFAPVQEVLDSWPEIQKKLLVANQAGASIYYGAHVRTEQWACFWNEEGKRKHKAFREKEKADQFASGFKPETGMRVTRAVLGEAENVIGCRIVYADLDYKDPALLEKNYAPLIGFNIRPTFVIDTGHGYHLIWILKEEVPHAVAEKIMRQLARVLTGDSVWDAPRILRLPGTMNVKAEPFVPCEIEKADPDRQYNPADFDPLEGVATGMPIPGKAPRAAAPQARPSSAVTQTIPTPPVYGNGHGFLAIMAMSLQPYWRDGARHKIALGLAGLMCHDGIPENVAAAVIEKIARMANDPEISDRITAVKSTYQKGCDSASGSTLVRDALGDEEGLKFIRAYRTVAAQVPPPPVKRLVLPDFDLYKCVPPGSIFEKHIFNATEQTDAPIQYHAASIITAAAAILGNRVYVEHYHGKKRLYPNLYTMITGPSTRMRKSTAIELVTRLTKAANVEVYPKSATVELLYKVMAKNPTQWCDKNGNSCSSGDKGARPCAWYGNPSGLITHSEFSAYLSTTAKSYMQDSRSFIMNIYDGAPYGESHETKTSGKYVIEDAAISMLCGVTLTSMQAFLSKEDIGNGFLQRFLVIMPPRTHKNRYGRKAHSGDVDAQYEIATKMEAMTKVSGAAVVDPEADEIHARFNEKMDKLGEPYEGTDKEHLGSFFGRLVTMAFKIATIYGTFAHETPRVDAASMTYACNFCKYVADGLEMFFDEVRPSDIRNQDILYEEKVIKAARKAWTCGEQPVRHFTLCRALHLTSDQVEKGVQSAIAKGILALAPNESRDARRRRYILNEVDAN